MMPHPPTCPVPVTDPTMHNDWLDLTFIHWRYPSQVVQRLLPQGLAVETFAGDAWVGLVPFKMRVSRPPIPSVPWFAEFLETNVRTYVRGPNGAVGVWFFSLDASRLGAVVAGAFPVRGALSMVEHVLHHRRLPAPLHDATALARRRAGSVGRNPRRRTDSRIGRHRVRALPHCPLGTLWHPPRHPHLRACRSPCMVPAPCRDHVSSRPAGAGGRSPGTAERTGRALVTWCPREDRSSDQPHGCTDGVSAGNGRAHCASVQRNAGAWRCSSELTRPEQR